MKWKLFFIAGWIICSGCGCTSLNGLVYNNTDLRNGEPLKYYRNDSLQYTSYSGDSVFPKAPGSGRTPAEIIAEGTVEEVKLAFRQGGFAQVYGDSKFDASYVPTSSSGTEIVLEWTSPATLYPPREYDLAKTQTHNKRAGLAFTYLVGEAVDKLLAKLREAGMRNHFHIKATYHGQSDAAPISRHLEYRGEWGPILMPAESTTLNGVSHAFRIDPGQCISNEELAALRCFSLKHYLRDILAKYQLRVDDRFAASISALRGAQYRMAKVTITLEND